MSTPGIGPPVALLIRGRIRFFLAALIALGHHQPQPILD